MSATQISNKFLTFSISQPRLESQYMPKTQPKTYALISLLERMIADMISGKKLQSNGNRYRPGTIDNYQFVRNNLAEFSLKKQFELRIRPIKSLGSRDLIVEKNYWGRFYRKFSEFMYSDWKRR